MKTSILCCAILFATAVSAQKAKPSTSAKKPPVFTPPVKYLKTQADSASYAIGLSVANFYKQQGITKLNSAAIAKAVEDIMGNKKPLLDDMQANNCIMTYMNNVQESKSKPTIEAGEKFLEANKKKAGVVTTASGLQWELV